MEKFLASIKFLLSFFSSKFFLQKGITNSSGERNKE